jgi:hypothetical protein
MSLETVVGLAVVTGLLVAMLSRQRGVYRTYRNAQQQALERQAETMALLQESLNTQKEVVRLLTIIASRERS